METKCPRCKVDLCRGHCLFCGYGLTAQEKRERTAKAPSFEWPPHANPNGEYHTHPLLIDAGGREED